MREHFLASLHWSFAISPLRSDFLHGLTLMTPKYQKPTWPNAHQGGFRNVAAKIRLSWCLSYTLNFINCYDVTSLSATASKTRCPALYWTDVKNNAHRLSSVGVFFCLGVGVSYSQLEQQVWRTYFIRS